MTKKEKVAIILELLHEHYGPTKCYLDHENEWQLLIATMLSAQCTDDRVNIVTKDLFQKYTSIKDFAEANLAELEQDIHSTGFYHNKAKNIIACCQKLLSEFGGEVPSDIDQLTSLANLGYLAGFVGMLTDSRSFLSYPRHEYFRRILCRLLGEWVEDGRLPCDMDLLSEIVKDISYYNAKRYFHFAEK